MVDQGNFKNLAITWFDESDNYVTTKDITNSVTSLPLFTETGSGEVNEAEFILSANFGNFVSSNGDETPIQQFDRFRIQCDDLAGDSYDHYFEIATLSPAIMDVLVMSG